MLLGVNIDHIAVLRNARMINDPDPLEALGIVRRAGGDQITIHLREDRRHIHDTDAKKIIENSFLPVNLECAIEPAIIDIVCELKPHRATLVPEKRQEVTTEGGLDILSNQERLKAVIAQLHDAHIEVSLFVDPHLPTIDACAQLGVEMIELHTGTYANVFAMLHTNIPYSIHTVESLSHLSRKELKVAFDQSIKALHIASAHAKSLHLKVAAGHGLNYHNLTHILAIPEIFELNIGQSIIARSIFTGLETAIKEMKALLR